MSYSDSIIAAESGGDPNAKNPNSSAAGAGQFIDGTWLSTIRAHRPDLAQGKSDAEILAMRSDPDLSKQMVDAYASDNQAVLSKNGLPVTPGTTYLAHFAGPNGAVKVLQADPNASAADILGPKVAAANPFLKNMTAGGLQAWAAKRVGAVSPVTGSQAASAPPQAGAPTPLQPPQPAAPTIPQPQAPIFAGQPAGGAAPQPYVPQPLQPIPIIASAPKQIDLSGLQAALARYRTPIFSRNT